MLALHTTLIVACSIYIRDVPLDSPQISKTWTAFFGGHCPKEVLRCDNVTISDFQNVRRKLEYVPTELRTKELILQNMLEELANKDDHQGRRLGL